MASQLDGGLSGTTVSNMQNTCHLLNIQTFTGIILGHSSKQTDFTDKFSVDADWTFSESVLLRCH